MSGRPTPAARAGMSGGGDWRDLVEQYSDAMALRARAQQVRAAANAIRRLAWTVGADLRAISPATIEAHLLALRAAGGAPKTLMNARSYISTFCRFLIGRGILAANPAAQVRLARPEWLPPEYLRDAERDSALAAARRAGIWPEVCLALATGLRVSELARLAWADVDINRRALLIRRSKSGRPRSVPLSAQALAALRAQRKISGGMLTVFPARRTWKGHWHYVDHPRCLACWTRALAPVQKAVPRFGTLRGVGRAWHLFRSTFASRLVQAGVSVYKVADWLGHSDVRMTQRYAALSAGYDSDIEVPAGITEPPARGCGENDARSPSGAQRFGGGVGRGDKERSRLMRNFLIGVVVAAGALVGQAGPPPMVDAQALLEAEVKALRATVQRQAQEIAALRLRIQELEAAMHQGAASRPVKTQPSDRASPGPSTSQQAGQGTLDLASIRRDMDDVKPLMGRRVFGRVQIVAIVPQKDEPGCFEVTTCLAVETKIGSRPILIFDGRPGTQYQIQCVLRCQEDVALSLKVADLLTIVGTVSEAELLKAADLYDHAGLTYVPMMSSGTGNRLVRLRLRDVKTGG